MGSLAEELGELCGAEKPPGTAGAPGSCREVFQGPQAQGRQVEVGSRRARRKMGIEPTSLKLLNMSAKFK